MEQLLDTQPGPKDPPSLSQTIANIYTLFTVHAVYTSTISFELYNYVWPTLYISLLLFIDPFL